MNHIKKLPEKISRVILRFTNMILKISININNENYKAYRETEYMGNLYVTMNLNPMLSLEMVKGKNEDTVFDRSNFFPIGQGNIGSIIKTMKKMLKSIYTQDIFAIQNNAVIMYEDMSRKFMERISIPRSGYQMILKPTVVYDDNDTSYEGVNIYLNKTDNVISLSIEEFENLVYTLEKIDLFTYSQMMFNSYLLVNNNFDESKKLLSSKYNIPSKPIIEWGNSKPKTSSNFRQIEEDNTFEGL